MKILNNNQKRGTILFLTLVLIVLVQSGCKKSLDVDLPINKVTAPSVFSNTGTAVSAINGVYIQLAQGGFADQGSGVSVVSGLLGDELVDNVDYGVHGPLYSHSFTDDPTQFWQGMYSQYVFEINSVIEGITASTGIPDGSKQVLLGEAKVVRALIYFNLVNLYGDVPLVTTTDFKTNSNIPRSPTATVYAKIIKDLTDAQQELTDQYLDGNLSSTTTDRVRPNKAAANALLARVYLYLGQWQNAADQASKIIDNPTYSLPPLNQVFLANSPGAIWQLQSILNTFDGFTITGDARYFIPLQGNVPQVYISSFLLNAFEANDNRKNTWIRTITSGADTFLIPNKYQAGLDGFATDPENTVVFRLGEQYLIRAEARAHLNFITGVNSAESDLNAIRSRAGLPGTTATDQTTMLAAILHERQVELFTEWGNRWYDLKRTGELDAVMQEEAPAKGVTWASYMALLPIPHSEFLLNPALKGHQNPGYPEF
jgi:hypothetical protein